MDAGFWIATAIAVAALVLTGLSWHQARRSANYTGDQLALLREQVDHEREERLDQQMAQARLVSIEIVREGLANLAVEIANHSLLPVDQVVLLNVVYMDSRSLRWQANRKVRNAPAVHQVLGGDDSVRFPIEFVNDDHALCPTGNGDYQVTIAFNDASGRRWKRTGAAPPELLGDSRILKDLPPLPPGVGIGN